MGAVGPWQIILVLVLAVLLFGGRGKISSIMGDFAKGIKSFRKGLEDEEKSIDDKAKTTMDAEVESNRQKQEAKD